MAVPQPRGESKDAFRNESEGDDDASDEDIETFRRACMLTGTNPNELSGTAAATTEGNASAAISDSDGDDSEFDDLELVRSIHQRFSIPSDDIQPLVLKPLRTLLPGASDDDEDDFETLRAIERRFAKYDSDAQRRNARCSIDKAELVFDKITELEQGAADTLFTNRDLDKGLDEESQSSEEAPFTSQPRESLEDVGSIVLPHSESFEASSLPEKYSHFPNPKSAHMFIDAIKRNRSCQRFIRSKLIQIEARIEENKKLKEHIKLIKDYQTSCKRRAGQLTQKMDPRVRLIQVRKSRKSQKLKENDKVRASHFGPVENSHAANYRMMLTKFPLLLHKQKWSEAEKENLGKGIKQQFQEMLLQKSLELLSVSEESCSNSRAFDEAIASITNLEITTEQIRSFLPKVDWERLASMYVAGRSGAECEARWLNNDDPIINQNSWTNTEDKNLLFILQRRGLHNWIDIAISLGTNRTPFQCLARYQRSLNAFILKRDWTEEEDSQLRAAVEAFGKHDWQLVASNLEGRTGTQCSNRWNKTLDPSRERVGRWTVEEDKRLKVAVMLFGPKTWNKIAQFVPGRTQVQCRERWVNVLDPSLNLGEWTEEEDSKLKAAIAEHGHCWSKVAACVPPRTDSQCRRRWKVLLPHEVPLLQAARRIQKAALISNFVDREEERPALGPGDFLPLPWNGSASAAENEADATENGKRTRAKRKSKQKDTTSCTDASTKIRSKRIGIKARNRSQDVSRTRNGDIEGLAGDDTIPKKKTVRKPRSRIKLVESTVDNQDLLLCSEPSMVSRIASSRDDNCIRDNKDSSKKERTSKLRTKRGKHRCTRRKHKEPLLSSDNANSLRRPNEGNANTSSGVRVNSKRKRIPKSLSKDVSCSESPTENQGTSLSSENIALLKHDAETSGIYISSPKKRNVSKSGSRKGKSIVPAQKHCYVSSHEEWSAFDGVDVAISGTSTAANIHSEDTSGKQAEDVTHSEDMAETMDENNVTLASFLQNKYGKRRSKTAKNMWALSEVLVPCSRKGKRTEPVQASQDFPTCEEQSAFYSMDITSNGMLTTADIPQEDTSDNYKSIYHAKELLETSYAEDWTLASFLHKKVKMRSGITKNDKVVSPSGRKRRKKAPSLLCQDNSSVQFAEDQANLQFYVHPSNDTLGRGGSSQ